MFSNSGSTGVLFTTNQQFEYLIHSNICPTEDEAAEIRKGLAIAADRVRARRQSPRLKNDTRQGEIDIFRTMQSYQKALSAVRRVPTEIWEEILTYCGEQYDGTPRPVDPCHIQLEEYPWVLARVCSQWREIIVDTPMFWTNIHMDLSRHPYDSRRLETVDTVIRRSKRVPINLRIESEPDVTPATLTRVARLLFGRQDKIKSLHFRMPFDHFQLMQEGIKPPTVTMLKRVCIDLVPLINLYRSHFQTEVNAFAAALQLKEFKIACSAGSLQKINLPWSQLESVDLTLTSAGDEVLQCVRHCPNMQTLTVRGFYKLPTDPTIVLRHEVLRQVTIDEVSMLNHLDLPSLVQLSVACRFGFDHYPSTLLRFLQRFGSNLEILEIRSFPLAYKVLVQILEQTPRLKEFKIIPAYHTSCEDASIVRRLFSSLLIQEGQDVPVLLPFLEVLHICLYNESKMPAVIDDQLIKMLDSRVGHVTPLRAFRLHVQFYDAQMLSLHSNISHHCIDSLRSLRERGLELDIGSPSKWVVL